MGLFISTVIYLSMFFLTIVCAKTADYFFNKQKRALGFVFLVFVIFLPSFLAGIRAETVGRDVLVYAERVFNTAKGFSSYWDFQNSLNATYGISILAFFLSRFFSDAGWLLFFLQILVMIPIVAVSYKNRKEIPMWLIVGVYLFVFYNNSLNIMKQSISCAFVLLSYYYLKEHKYLFVIILWAIAFIFHPSAIIGFAIIVSVLWSGKINRSFNKIVFFVFFIIILLNIQSIAYFLLDNNILSQKFRMTIMQFFEDPNSYLRIRSFSLPILYDWFFRLLMIVLPFVLFNKESKEKNLNLFLIVLIGFIIYSYTLFKYRSVYGGRITLYCDFFYIMLFPSVINSFKGKAKSNANNFTVFLFLFTYWFPWVMLFGWSASNNFAFRF